MAEGDMDWLREEFKKAKTKPVIEPLYFEMIDASAKRDFERASQLEKQIEEKIDKIECGGISSLGTQGLDEVARRIKCYEVRIAPDSIGKRKFIKLSGNVFDRLGDEGRTPEFRKVVAEEMVNLRIDIPTKRRGGPKPPNRAFLDVLERTSPNTSTAEILRREKSKLWHAVKTGRGLDEVKAKIKELKERELRD